MAELANRQELESEVVRKLGWLSKQHKNELRELLGSPPRYENVPQSWWDKVEKEHNLELLALLALLLAASAEQHGLSPSRAKQVGEQWAEQRATQVSREFMQKTREKLAIDSRRWAQAVTPSPGQTPSEVKQAEATVEADVEQSLDSVLGDGRAERLGVTETTNAQHTGSEIAVQETVGTSPDDIWHTEQDRKVCPICTPLDRTPRSFWSRFFPQGPPGPHPRCRCWIEYVNVTTPAQVAGTP